MLKTYLDIKSGYSFLQSTLQVKEFVALAKENKIENLGLCDVNNLFGAMEFSSYCLKANIKPLFGIDVTVIENDGKSYSFLLYAKTLDGYHTLTRLTKKVSRFDNRYGISFLSLIEDLKDVLVILPLYRSYLYSLFQLGNQKSLLETIQKYQEYFPSFYVGIPYDLGNQSEIDAIRLYLQEQQIKRVALPLINARNRQDHMSLAALKAIEQQSTIKGDFSSPSIGFFDEIIDNSFYTFEELTALEQISKECNVSLTHFPFHFVHYEKISGKKSIPLLVELAKKGLHERVKNVTLAYEKRLAYELDVIIKMGFADYFLVVYDYVNYAKNQGILVGPGRGSAAGSLVSYSLRITDVDPIQFHLMFERFLNIERISMPDIDIDFPDNRRQEVIDYIKQRYGLDHTAHVISFQTFGARQALRDSAKVFGLQPYQVDYLVKKLPSYDSFSTLEQYYEKYPQFQKTIDEDPLYQKIFKVAKRLEGLPRQSSLHAAGIVVSDLPLEEVVPIYSVSENTIATQFDMNYIEAVGLLKMDILGLKNLAIIDDCLKDIKQIHHLDLDYKNLNYEDEGVYQMISSGKTMGVFQLEKSGMIQAIKKVAPNSFEDIVATIALYRPGPMAFIDDYCARKKGEMEITYLHPLLEPILKVTYGIIVYQEQIILILTSLANFSLGKADVVRRAISKKQEHVMASIKQEFMEGCIQNHLTLAVANEVFALIERFSDYGFVRAHSVSYAVICYTMAYIKYHYPSIFFANILNAFGGTVGKSSKFMQYIDEASTFGIKVLSPSINHSQMKFTAVSDHEILYSLSNILGVNQGLALQIIEERKKREYDDIFDFIKRIYSSSFGEKQLASLIHAGCFDEFHINRATLLHNMFRLFQYGQIVSSIPKGPSLMEDDLTGKPLLTFVKDDEVEKLYLEFEAIGLFLSGFPLAGDRSKLNKKRYIRICDMIEEPDQRVFLVLYVHSYQTIKTKKGALMARLNCYDETGFVEVIVFPKLYQVIENLLKNEHYIKLDAKVSIQNDTLSLQASRIQPYQLGED